MPSQNKIWVTDSPKIRVKLFQFSLGREYSIDLNSVQMKSNLFIFLLDHVGCHLLKLIKCFVKSHTERKVPNSNFISCVELDHSKIEKIGLYRIGFLQKFHANISFSI